MTLGVLKVIALICQRIERLIFDLPPCPATAHQGIDVAFAHPHVGHPTQVLHLLSTHVPVRKKVPPHVRIRLIEGDIIPKAKAMHETRSTIVPLIRGDASRLLGRLDLLEHIGMITFFHPQDIPEIMGVQGLDMRSVSTEAVFRDEELEVGMILTPLGHKAFGGMAFAIIFVHAIVVRHRLGHERNDGPLVRMDDRSAHHLMGRGDGPVAVDPVSTGGAVHRLGRKIPRTIKGQEIMAIKKCHRLKRLATLELPKDAREHWAEPRGGDRVQDFAHVRIARDPLNAVDGVQIPRSPFLGKGRHERIG